MSTTACLAAATKTDGITGRWTILSSPVLTQLSCKLAPTLQSKMCHTQLTEHAASDNIVQSKRFSPILPNPKSPNFILQNHKTRNASASI